MAYDAGAIVGKINLETGEFSAGMQGAVNASEGMTGSFLKAQVIFAAVEKAFHAIVDVVKDSIHEWEAEERQVALINAALASTGDACGMTSQEIVKLSEDIQRNTGVANDSVMQAETMLLTFTKIGRQTFPEATKAIVDMSQRFGDFESNARIVGRALQDPINGLTMLQRVGIQFTESQKQQIANFMSVNNLAGAQNLILAELEKRYGGAAAAIRNTFGGAVQALHNDVMSLKETLGSYVAAIGRPIVESLDAIVNKVNDFLASKQGMEEVSSILGQIGGAFATIKAIVEPLVNVIQTQLLSVWNTLKAEITKIIGPGKEASVVFTALAVAGKAVALAITIFATGIKYGIKIIADMIEIVKDAGSSIGAFVEALKDFQNPQKWAAVQNAAKKTGDDFKQLGSDIVGSLVDPIKIATDGIKGILDNAVSDGKALQTSYEEAVKKTKDATLAYLQQTTTASKEANKEIKEDAEKEAGYVSAAWKKSFSQIQAYVSPVVSTIQTAWNGITQIWGQALQNEATAEDNDYIRKKANIEANVTDETERKKQLQALEDDHNKKKGEIAKKQFQQQQASAVANVVFSTAQAIMQSYAQLGPIGGTIAAVIMAGIGAVEIGMILSEEPPAYAEGGDIAAGQAGIVGDAGQPELFVPKTSGHIYTMDQARNTFGGGGMHMENNFYGDMNTQIDFDRTMHMMGASFRAMQRGYERGAA